MYKTYVWILQEENSWGLEISVPVSDAQLRPWIWISGLIWSRIVWHVTCFTQTHESNKFPMTFICSFWGAFDHQIQHLGRAFERNFGTGVQRFEQANLRNFKWPGDWAKVGGGGGGCWSFKLIALIDRHKSKPRYGALRTSLKWTSSGKEVSLAQRTECVVYSNNMFFLIIFSSCWTFNIKDLLLENAY